MCVWVNIIIIVFQDDWWSRRRRKVSLEWTRWRQWWLELVLKPIDPWSLGWILIRFKRQKQVNNGGMLMRTSSIIVMWYDKQHSSNNEWLQRRNKTSESLVIVLREKEGSMMQNYFTLLTKTSQAYLETQRWVLTMSSFRSEVWVMMATNSLPLNRSDILTDISPANDINLWERLRIEGTF